MFSVSQTYALLVPFTAFFVFLIKYQGNISLNSEKPKDTISTQLHFLPRFITFPENITRLLDQTDLLQINILTILANIYNLKSFAEALITIS